MQRIGTTCFVIPFVSHKRYNALFRGNHRYEYSYQTRTANSKAAERLPNKNHQLINKTENFPRRSRSFKPDYVAGLAKL